jgi:diadenosine tetraphosphate (Ap4A) HIT family hydrolase
VPRSYSCYPARLDCPFCNVAPGRIWIETEHAIALADPQPISDGHTIVFPRKHVSTVYELTISEQESLWALVSEVRRRLLTGLTPDGFSIGFNDTLQNGAIGEHAAVLIVPRRCGDNVWLRRGADWITDDLVFVEGK